MWSAFMNGGGGGGGYVPSPGWEFVPCSRMDRVDRGRRRSHSPLRRISSPPTVFSQQFDAGQGEPGTLFEVHRGQMWPGPEPQQQQQQHQTQQGRLKKKLEDLKKRHGQDKEGWMREKESLLREMADIQGGENRRILLDMKTVLEEVQLEVKREEEKRNELQLQYTRDKWSWELEKAELKCRIGQLEARKSAGLIVGGGQLAQEKHGETLTLRREREEQRRLLEDTRSTAMDLRCRLELSERDWSREKAELMERFDVERREWESQLRDMQKKIEELYCEVRTKREGTSGRSNHEDVNSLSIRSTSSGSSSARSEASSSGSWSGTALPGFAHSCKVSGVDGSGDGHLTCFQDDPIIKAGGQKEHSQHELIELSSRETWQHLSVTETTDPGDIVHGSPVYDVDLTIRSSNSEENDTDGLQKRSPWSEPSYGSEKKRNTTALNAALKEIARVSKELCSYQDEIRKKTAERRSHCEALCLQEDHKVKSLLEVKDSTCEFSQIYNDSVELEQEKWLTLSSENVWHADRGSNRETPEILTDLDDAPPIPPRTSSWNLSTATQPDNELHIPESPLPTIQKCHSPCGLLDRKCSSPSIVRKFGAMLQENEGKILIDGVLTSCSVPANSKCNVGCCHSRWSCDASKFSKAAEGPVQKSFSEVNILTARKDNNFGFGGLRDAQVPPSVKDLPLDSLLSRLEISPAGLQTQASKRNITLEQKTAEFNRTLFHAEMGRGVEEQDSLAVRDARPEGCQPSHEVLPPRETQILPGPTNAASGNSDALPSLPASDATGHGGGRGPDLVPMDLSCEQPPIAVKEASAPPCPADNPDVSPFHPARTPLKNSQHKATTEAPSSEFGSSGNIQPGQNEDNSRFKNESPSKAKPQAARGGVSLLQPPVDNKQRQMSQPRHASVPPLQSDGGRPAPRLLNDHPWKPLTLAAYPRPEGSRSNYGALERILKNYASAARAEEHQSQRREATSGAKASIQKAETIAEVGTLDMDSLRSPLTTKYAHTHAQLSNCSSACGTVQGSKEFSSAPKNFLRPGRPANRRLPSRWARASSTSSSSNSTSSSPSTTPAPPPIPLHTRSSTFTFSHSFQMETLII